MTKSRVSLDRIFIKEDTNVENGRASLIVRRQYLSNAPWRINPS